MSWVVATVGGVGYIKPASGTWGSLAALPLGWAVNEVTGPVVFIIVTLAVTLIGWWATEAYTADRPDKDPSEVVIDEVVGQWIALWPVFIGAAHVGASTLSLWPGWVVAFIAFRGFDVLKPGPIGWADRRGDALGVMLDDCIAGVAAAVTVILGAVLWHVVIL